MKYKKNPQIDKSKWNRVGDDCLLVQCTLAHLFKRLFVYLRKVEDFDLKLRMPDMLMITAEEAMFPKPNTQHT